MITLPPTDMRTPADSTRSWACARGLVLHRDGCSPRGVDAGGRLVGAPAPGAALAVDGGAEGRAHQPALEGAAVAQRAVGPVRADVALLGHVLGLLAVAQDAEGHPEGQTGELGHPRLELA